MKEKSNQNMISLHSFQGFIKLQIELYLQRLAFILLLKLSYDVDIVCFFVFFLILYNFLPDPFQLL